MVRFKHEFTNLQLSATDPLMSNSFFKDNLNNLYIWYFRQNNHFESFLFRTMYTVYKIQTNDMKLQIETRHQHNF